MTNSPLSKEEKKNEWIDYYAKPLYDMECTVVHFSKSASFLFLAFTLTNPVQYKARYIDFDVDVTRGLTVRVSKVISVGEKGEITSRVESIAYDDVTIEEVWAVLREKATAVAEKQTKMREWFPQYGE